MFGGSLAASAALLSVHKIGNQATQSRIAWLPEEHNLMGIVVFWGNAFTLILRFFRHEVAENMFAEERTLDSLAAAGYENGFKGLPLSERVTHLGTHGFPDATFDFIFVTGLTALQPNMRGPVHQIIGP